MERQEGAAEEEGEDRAPLWGMWHHFGGDCFINGLGALSDKCQDCCECKPVRTCPTKKPSDMRHRPQNEFPRTSRSASRIEDDPALDEFMIK